MKAIWQRYFLREIAKIFCLFVGCFYFLYVLIDYSVHTKELQSELVTFLQILAYYACQFTKRAEILITIAILIATIKVLTTANTKLEIVALVTGGIPIKRILRPFIWGGIGCALLLYANCELLQPFCMQKISAFEDRVFRGNSTHDAQVHSLILEDNTTLIYQSYNPEQLAFRDVFWMKDINQIYRIQSLHPYETVPLGKYVDVLTRTPGGELVKSVSYDACTFPQIRFEEKALYAAVHPPREQSIRELSQTMTWKQLAFSKMTDREAESATFFLLKLASPLFCLLAVLAPAPFCLKFSRSLPVYLIYALSLFGMIAFYAFVNSCVILGESQVIPPLLAILLPLTALPLVLIRYAKL